MIYKFLGYGCQMFVCRWDGSCAVLNYFLETTELQIQPSGVIYYCFEEFSEGLIYWPSFLLFSYSLWLLNIESAKRVPVDTNFDKTRSCSLHATLSVLFG
jgi:hypothetical protein